MFLAHSAILNGLPTDAMAEITIYNRQLHNKVFEQITTPSDNPNYRKYTKELNGILCDKMSESNNIVHEKYITVATEKKNIEEARTFFTRVGNDLIADYAKISSKIAELGYKDRLRIFNDFFKTGENEEFDFDLKKAMAKGADFKDYIAPDSLEFKKDYIKIGDKYARTVFLKEYPSFLKDSMISELTDFSRSMMLSITIQPIPT